MWLWCVRCRCVRFLKVRCSMTPLDRTLFLLALLTALCVYVYMWLQIKSALKQAGLSAGAVNIRFPDTFQLGAFTNPDPTLRAAAVALAAEGCSTAAELGAGQVVVWSPYDGYDYYLQVCRGHLLFCVRGSLTP